MAGGVGRSCPPISSTVVGEVTPPSGGDVLHASHGSPSPRQGGPSPSRPYDGAALGVFGVPVAESLSAGGFQDPTSESARAAQILIDKFGRGQPAAVRRDRAGRFRQRSGARRRH